MVFDEDVDLADIVLRIASFFRDESAGSASRAGSGPSGRRRRWRG